MNHLRILEGVLKEASKSFGTLELIALASAHIGEYCQNRQERREAYRIAAKIIKCDAKQIKAICEKLDQLQSRLNLNFDGGCDND